MSDLFSSLTMASRSLKAQQTGLDVVGQNVANANTVGYTRRVVDFAAVPAYDRWSAGGGVEVDALRSVRDVLLEQRLCEEEPAGGRAGAMADGLSIVEAALGESGQSIDASLDAFFDAFAQLAEDPVSSTYRTSVLVQGASLATTFNDMATRLEAAITDANTQVGGAVDRLNVLCQKIADLNTSIAKGGGINSTTLGLRDDLNEAVRELSQLADVSTITRSDGGLDVSLVNGRALVIGENSYGLQTTRDSDGHVVLLNGGVDVTAQVKSGKLGGLIEVRDVLVPGYMDKLDAMAYELASQVNALHTGGLDLNGAGGLSFFAPLASQDGAAAALAVNPTVAANPNLVAAGGTTAVDNENAVALANLRNARVLDGGTATFTDAWAALVYEVGQDSATATTERTSRQDVILQLDALRDQVSGVSLDEEAAMMMKFQRAYEANARFFTVIDQAIQTLLSMGS